MRGKQFPPRGPRSNHVKVDVTTEERKEWEAVARDMGTTVVEAVKVAMRIQARRIADSSHESTRPDVPGFDPVWNESQHKWTLVKRGDHVPAVVREATREICLRCKATYPSNGWHSCSLMHGVGK